MIPAHEQQLRDERDAARAQLAESQQQTAQALRNTVDALDRASRALTQTTKACDQRDAAREEVRRLRTWINDHHGVVLTNGEPSIMCLAECADLDAVRWDEEAQR